MPALALLGTMSAIPVLRQMRNMLTWRSPPRAASEQHPHPNAEGRTDAPMLAAAAARTGDFELRLTPASISRSPRRCRKNGRNARKGKTGKTGETGEDLYEAWH